MGQRGRSGPRRPSRKRGPGTLAGDTRRALSVAAASRGSLAVARRSGRRAARTSGKRPLARPQLLSGRPGVAAATFLESQKSPRIRTVSPADRCTPVIQKV